MPGCFNFQPRSQKKFVCQFPQKHISYQELKVVAENLNFHPGEFPHGGSRQPEQPLTCTQAGLCTWLPSLKVWMQGEGGRVTTTCAKVQDVRLQPSFSAWHIPLDTRSVKERQAQVKQPQVCQFTWAKTTLLQLAFWKWLLGFCFLRKSIKPPHEIGPSSVFILHYTLGRCNLNR